MLNTSDLDDVATIAAKYPVCYNTDYMLARSPTVLRRPQNSVINDDNFVTPWKYVERVNNALIQFVKQQDKRKVYELVDAGPDDDVAAAYVVSEMGGFSM